MAEKTTDKIYSIKEIYYTLQGEGFHAGRPAVFCRFSGCNLWTGREEDRHKAICQFCDTNFWGTDGINGGKYNAEELANTIHSIFSESTEKEHAFVVFTGGEPALQIDEALVQAMHDRSFEVAIETNGTLAIPANIDWVTVSPKANTEIRITTGNEMKIVFPQPGINPKDFSEQAFDHFYLQPMDSKDWEENAIKTINYCKEHPQWKMSVQIHKILNIP